MSRRHLSTHRIICWRFTRHCNRTCAFCVSSSGPSFSNPRLDLPQVFTRLRDLGVEKVTYSGGEPLLHPQLEAALNTGTRFGIQQVLTTNGDVLIKRHLPWLNGFQYVKLSFYGTAATHDAIMGAGHYHSLLEVARRDSGRGIAVGANFMLSSPSLEQVNDFLADAHKTGMQQVLLLTYMELGQPNVDEFYRFSHSLDRLAALAEITRDNAAAFPGGVKIHDYSVPDFYVILEEDLRFVLPREGFAPFLMGRLYDATLSLPEGNAIPAQDALRWVWARRLKTDAIVPI